MPTKSPQFIADQPSSVVRPPIPPDAVDKIGWALRLALLVLVGLLVLVTTREPLALVWVMLLAVAALPAWLPPYHGPLAPLGRLAEVLVTALGASALEAEYSRGTAAALLPYLTVPIVMPAMAGRLRES